MTTYSKEGANDSRQNSQLAENAMTDENTSVAPLLTSGSSRQRERTRGQAPVTTGGLPGARSNKGVKASIRSETILWNIPEQKSGKIIIMGGHIHSFSSVVKTIDYFKNIPIKETVVVMPDALKKTLPPVPNLIFTKSTGTGSFAKSPELAAALNSADLALLAGDFSKNSATTVAIADALAEADTPTVWAKDTVDLLAPEAARLLPKGSITIIATLSQLQKLLRAIYYPKMLLLSMPIQPVKELLHKFTLSYPVTLLTFHDGQILLANSGDVKTVPLNKTDYSPLTLWTTDLPAKISALQLWNKSDPLPAAQTALTWHP